MRKLPPCSDEMFVVAWQGAKALADVVKVCGYTTKYADRVVTNRAARLRAKGVRLKSFKVLAHIPKLQWLAERAEKDRQ